MAKEGDVGARTYDAKFCVLATDKLAVFNERDDDAVIRAQARARIDDSMLASISSMLDAARAGGLEGRAALQLECVAW